MTSLPKRGDRVRVTAVGEDPTVSLHPRHEVTLACDAHVHHEEWVHFDYVTVFGQKWSGAVKVEILERALPSLVDHVYIESHSGDRCLNCGRSSRDIPEGEKCGVSPKQPIHPDFARGMRRAVEIARKLEAELDQYDWFSVGELSEAVEKELAK